MTITASMVKELREATGAGMMECKKMLTETNGDIEAAIEQLRKRGAAQADKKGIKLSHIQSNAEHQLIEAIHNSYQTVDFIIITRAPCTLTIVAICNA